LNRKFNKLEQASKRAGRQRHIPMDIHDHEIFTKEFLEKYSDFTDFADYEAKSKDLNLHENAEFIKQHTKFNTFQEMIDKGIEEIDPMVMRRKIAQAVRKKLGLTKYN